MKSDLLNIKTAYELLDFMSINIKYGYLGKSGKVYYYEDKDFYNKWYSEYVLESKDDILKNLVGTCFDQVELERFWFERNNYEVKTFFEMVKLNYENNYPMHTFLAFKDGDKWYYFENADNKNRGIHAFSSLDELLKYQYNKYIEYLREFDILDKEIKNIIIKEYFKPKERIGIEEFIEEVL